MDLSTEYSSPSDKIFAFSPWKGGCSTLPFGSKSKNRVGISLNLLAEKPIIQVGMARLLASCMALNADGV